jgi:nitrite reductase (NADH) small subunit
MDGNVPVGASPRPPLSSDRHGPNSDRHGPARPGHLPQHDVASDGPIEPRHDEEGTTWIRVGTLDDIPRLGSRVVQARAEDIAVFRTADDRVFAIFDRCPHKQGKLSQGIVHGTSVTCPLHNWVIGLDDGIAKDPDEGCVRTVPVKLEGRDIMLAIVA